MKAPQFVVIAALLAGIIVALLLLRDAVEAQTLVIQTDNQYIKRDLVRIAANLHKQPAVKKNRK